jgi:alpha-tubulin suppressor-like RCC1 family protein
MGKALRVAVWSCALVIAGRAQGTGSPVAYVYAWGAGGQGQIGDGMSTTRPAPVRVAGLSSVGRVIVVAAGSTQSLCALPDGTTYAWGSNGSGELGDGSVMVRPSPVQVGTAQGFTSVSRLGAGSNFSIALLSDGTLRGWGANGFGQVGDASNMERHDPVLVHGVSNAFGISCGASHALAALADGSVRAWGLNSNGQLGDTTVSPRSTPFIISGLGNVTEVACGGSHSLAAISDGTVRAWGANLAGQLGDGSNMERHAPVTVTGLANVIAVAAGGQHSLAIVAGGTVQAWGANDSGQLGDGSVIVGGGRPTAAAVPGLTHIVQIVAVSQSSYAMSSDGRLWAWGRNLSSELGLGAGDTQDRHSPTEVTPPAGMRFEAISGGAAGNHVVALLSCRADFNRNGTINVQDIFDFLTQWFVGNTSTDYDHSGVATIPDLVSFLNAWLTPCP